MIDLATALLGPLAVPECRRSVARGWLILVRTLAALVAGCVALGTFWNWWFGQKYDEGYSPFSALRVGLLLLEGMALTIALVMSPAVLAGSLAGEKQRGTLGLLLTTAVSAREIVTGRLVGKLSQVAMMLLACLPLLVLLAVPAGLAPPTLAAMLGLPAAVTFGGGGVAIAASALARRGRDALFGVYLLVLLCLLGPLLDWSLGIAVGGWFGALNPFFGMADLVWNEEAGHALRSIGLWGTIGLLGTALASLRLRPACLSQLGGAARRRGRKWRVWVPPVRDNPMLWKELFIEQAGTLGRFGLVLGLFLILLLAGGSTALAGLIGWELWVRADPEAADVYRLFLGNWITGSAFLFGCLIQWAIGLRAAVAISSERELGTWDALLTSPLEGTEIVRGKLWGSLFALRWLFAATFWAWSLALACGAMSAGYYFFLLASSLVIGAFMAAIGVRTSLASATATKAMAVTIGIWLGAAAASAFVALVVTAVAHLIYFLLWLLAVQLNLAQWGPGPWFPISFGTAYVLVLLATYALATAMAVAEARVRFDRIAGRMAGGQVAIAVDQMLHGRPMPPVLPEVLGRPGPKPKPQTEDEGLEILEDLDPR